MDKILLLSFPGDVGTSSPPEFLDDKHKLQELVDLLQIGKRKSEITKCFSSRTQ